MTLSIFTNSQIISLEEGAADMFMNIILTPDASRQVQAVQTYREEMMARAIQLPLTNGIDEVKKKMILSGLADLKEGERFLCNGAMISDLNSPEARYYLRLVAYLNDGKNRSPQEAQNMAREAESAYAIRSKEL